MLFSQRYTDSGGAFGFYDLFPVGEAAALGLDAELDTISAEIMALLQEVHS